jgi:DNA-binding transcriptional regulator WhiA
MNIRTTPNPEFKITEHARLRASERDVSLKELAKVFSDRDYVTKHSKKDPVTKRFVLRYKNLRVIWQLAGGAITVLSVFSR